MLSISVVTATFNRADTIGCTLDSVQGQDYGAVEHVVQDGGSTDATLDIVTRKATPWTRVESAPDAGLYDAINKGIARAQGDVIGLLHSDDFFADEAVLSRVAAAFGDPTVDGVYGDLDYVAASDPSRIVRRWRSGAYDPAALRRGWMPPHPTLYLRRSVFDRWGAYDTSFRIAADYDAVLRYLGAGRIRLAYLPHVLVKMRTGGESNRSLSAILRKSREDYTALRRNRVGGMASLMRKNLSKIPQFFAG